MSPTCAISLEAHLSGRPHAVADSAEYLHNAADATVPDLPGWERTQHEAWRYEAGACVRVHELPGRQKAGEEAVWALLPGVVHCHRVGDLVGRRVVERRENRLDQSREGMMSTKRGLLDCRGLVGVEGVMSWDSGLGRRVQECHAFLAFLG